MTSLQAILKTGTASPLSTHKILRHTARTPSLSKLGLRTNTHHKYYSTNTTPAPTTAQSTASAQVSTPIQKQSRFRQYAEQFKNKPASHLISFGILHEITAIVPLPIIYFGLVETGINIPFPEQAIEEGNRFVGKVAKYYGWNMEGADGARMMLNMATSYAVVKAFMPLRLALCVWMTPWTATRIVSPVMNFWRRFKK
ncbi:hypothetical protein CPC16_009856 [Podila verticillata]|nr:hypothetical protein BGZ52_000690 [Haplosporangium bisporale]KAF9214770.1 hypothetical protein BGZ59_003028 [Podila verticillata]KAF9394911.1 hypothetical protein CPC16_009856 [Podila verticillata]KAI9236517.1 MAG: hypothetical protein BYD32DRAFT_369681 [Podila humilis]KFH65549.1 hypothetical protein MVEG_09025 [Podila verticillata NRRL 6337]